MNEVHSFIDDKKTTCPLVDVAMLKNEPGHS